MEFRPTNTNNKRTRWGISDDWWKEKHSKLTKEVEDVKELKKEGVKLWKGNQDLVRLNNHIAWERDELRLANDTLKSEVLAAATIAHESYEEKIRIIESLAQEGDKRKS
jgi:hypothetical protein